MSQEVKKHIEAELHVRHQSHLLVKLRRLGQEGVALQPRGESRGPRLTVHSKAIAIWQLPQKAPESRLPGVV